MVNGQHGRTQNLCWRPTPCQDQTWVAGRQARPPQTDMVGAVGSKDWDPGGELVTVVPQDPLAVGKSRAKPAVRHRRLGGSSCVRRGKGEGSIRRCQRATHWGCTASSRKVTELSNRSQILRRWTSRPMPASPIWALSPGGGSEHQRPEREKKKKEPTRPQRTHLGSLPEPRASRADRCHTRDPQTCRGGWAWHRRCFQVPAKGGSSRQRCQCLRRQTSAGRSAQSSPSRGESEGRPTFGRMAIAQAHLHKDTRMLGLEFSVLVCVGMGSHQLLLWSGPPPR
jgi:hypothetical protein